VDLSQNSEDPHRASRPNLCLSAARCPKRKGLTGSQPCCELLDLFRGLIFCSRTEKFDHSSHVRTLPPHEFLGPVLMRRIRNVNLPIISLCLCSPCGPWPLFQFLNLYTVSRTPWTGDQPVARPLPTHRITQTQNKRTQTSMPRVGFEPMIPVFDGSCLTQRGHCDRRTFLLVITNQLIY
jgi:hypothetical protein